MSGVRTRAAVAVAVVVAVAAVVAVVVLQRGGRGGGEAVAHVGAATVTRPQLDEAVEHFEEEAKAEGKPFPKQGTPAYREVQRSLLGLLVYQAELAEGARRLGIRVSQDDVDRRLAQAKGEDADARRFGEQTVRAQLVYERVYRRLTGGVSVTDDAVATYYRAHRSLFRHPPRTLAEATPQIRAELLARKKNTIVQRWIAQTRRRLDRTVRYEPGFGAA